MKSILLNYPLTHWGLVIHMWNNSVIIGSGNGLSLLSTKPWPSQCSFIAHGTVKNKLQWNFIQNTETFFQENSFENVIYYMSTILFSSQLYLSTSPSQSSRDNALHAHGNPLIRANQFLAPLWIFIGLLQYRKCHGIRLVKQRHIPLRSSHTERHYNENPSENRGKLTWLLPRYQMKELRWHLQ